MKKLTLTLSCAGLASLLASVAVAQPVAQPQRAPSDYSDFRGGPEALVRVIRNVETNANGHVLDIRYGANNGPGYYVAVDQGGQVLYEWLARDGGALVTVSEQVRPAWMLHWRQRTDVEAAEHAKISLADAIHTAERASGGVAVAAGLSPDDANASNSVTAYNVLVLDTGRGLRRIAVDDQSGEIIANPSAMSNP